MSADTNSSSNIIVDTSEVVGFDVKKYGSAVVIIVLIIIVASVAFYKTEAFTSPDGVIAGKKGQIRSDTEVDRTWNLKQLEKSVALINSKA